MSTSPLKPCSYPNCKRLVSGARCAEHQPKESERPNADVRTWYHTPRWRALRADALRRMPFCPECAELGLRVKTTDADHIVPHRGDPSLFWNLGNLQGKCHAHHSAKTGRGE